MADMKPGIAGLQTEGRTALYQHIFIEDVTPRVDGGLYPAKRIVGETCVVEADLLREGHAELSALVKWKRKSESRWREAPMALVNNDRWRGAFPLDEIGRYQFTIEAWTDHFATWLADLKKRIAAKQDIATEVIEGRHQIEAVLPEVAATDRAFLEKSLVLLGGTKRAEQILKVVTDERLLTLLRHGQRRTDLATFVPALEILVERERARTGAWYEMFVGSEGSHDGTPGTFREAEARLRVVRDMGFDVIYLPPVHPRGRTDKKGRNNSLQARPEDPGSPWAIGNEAGGHTAIDPNIGTIHDFDRFVSTARSLGMEVAMDFAIQASPDHPWVRTHPDWFHHRPDGTIKFAENPPKKYQDIYPINFDTPDREGLWRELKGVLDFWIERGVRIFRVDNPHTKPFVFWKWAIADIQREHPDVVFLAEAFTRPKVMKLLAKLGFSQSYTYFTWRNSKHDLAAYLTELTTSGMQDFFRPNFFANTPDILPPILQKGGRAAFKMRFVLAATLSPAYGIYSGYELCENEAVPGTEEYLHSEKYEYKPRNWSQSTNISEFIARVNAIRRDNPALREFTNLTFLGNDNDQVLCYLKQTADRSNQLIVAVNLDPHRPHHTTAWVPPDLIGVPRGAGYQVRDLISDQTWAWSEHNFIRLDPLFEPAHILRIERAH